MAPLPLVLYVVFTVASLAVAVLCRPQLLHRTSWLLSASSSHTLSHTHLHTVLDSLAFALVSHPYGQPLLFLLILLTTIRQSFPMLSSLFFSHNNSTPPLLFHPHPLVRLHLRALGWRPHLLFRCLVRRPFGLHSFSRVSSQSHRLVAQ